MRNGYPRGPLTLRARNPACVFTQTRPTRAPRADVARRAAALALGGAIIGGPMWWLMRPMPPRVERFTIGTGSTALAIGFGNAVAITPDGTRIVYVGDSGSALFVRAFDQLEPTPIVTGAVAGPGGGAGARSLSIAPDGQWVGFVESATTLKKVTISGGPVVTVTQMDGISRGAVWLPGDTIVFATSATGTGLQRVAAGGGEVTVLTRPDPAKGQVDHAWPEMLPGGRAVLFTIIAASGGSTQRRWPCSI